MRKVIGIGLYFIGIGLWVILLFWGVVLAVPLTVLAFCAGYLTHARPWPEMREWRVWAYVRDKFFKFKIYGEIPEEKVIYAIYPHGHFSLSAVFVWALNPQFADATAVIHSALFYMPIVGTFARWIGAVGATESEMKRALEKGSIYMCPGGVADICNEGTDLKKRRGFLRIAREVGVRVVPVWCPEERSYYSHCLPLGHTLTWLLGFPVPMIIWGKWWCPLLPNTVESSPIVLGDPMEPDDELFWEEMEKLQNLPEMQR